MKHAGKAQRAGLRILFLSLLILLALGGMGLLAFMVGSVIKFVFSTLVLVWILFAAFTLYFFRDPEADPPPGNGLILAPAHGKVDVIDEIDGVSFLPGRCRRISIFLSVFDVHVQQAPVSGRIIELKHTSGQFFNAIHADCSTHNENVLLGVELDEAPGVKIGVRLIAGLIARRIIPWVSVGESVVRGQRISLIQFGSRCDLLFPLDYQPRVQLGDKVRGGETILASLK